MEFRIARRQGDDLDDSKALQGAIYQRAEPYHTDEYLQALHNTVYLVASHRDGSVDTTWHVQHPISEALQRLRSQCVSS